VADVDLEAFKMSRFLQQAVLWDTSVLEIAHRQSRGRLRAEGSFHFASKAVFLVAIAGGEVEGNKSRNARSLCDVTGLTCRKMPPLCGNLRIRVKKRRLDEELVSTPCQRDDPVDVLVVISGVDHIDNLLSLGRAQRVGFESISATRLGRRWLPGGRFCSARRSISCGGC
jgi:hypothetical protein